MHVLEPIKPLVSGLYRCDSKFHLESLYEQLEQKNTFGFLVVDGNGVTGHLLNGNSRKTLFRYDVSLPRKHGRGGQSKNRFERIREEKRGWYTSKIAELAVSSFINPVTSQPNVTGIVLAGSAQLKEDVLQKLDPRLARIVIAVIDVQYGGESGFNQAVFLTKDQLGNLKFVHEQNILSKLFEEISKDGKYAIGVDDTMYALTAGLLDSLILWNDLSVNRIELVRKDAPNDTPKILYLSSGKKLEETEYQEWTVKSNGPLLDWILDHFKEFGCQLELVSDQTNTGGQFVKGFGGLGGLLRYQVELPSMTDETENENDTDFDYTW